MIFCRVRSYLSTYRKQVMTATQALTLLFQGKSPVFMDSQGSGTLFVLNSYLSRSENGRLSGSLTCVQFIGQFFTSLA